MLATLPRKKKAKTPPAQYKMLDEFLTALGNIAPERVCFTPAPTTATKRDLLRLHRRSGKRFELVDGTLVENPMGSPESYLAMELGCLLRIYLTSHDMGFLYGSDALIEVNPGQVRGPDVSFVSWAKRPQKTVPGEPISDLVPDLTVEVLSPANTRGEIARKLSEYFTGGVRLVWVIDPRKRTAAIHTSPEDSTLLDESGTLDGGDVLPGFRVPLAKLFERLEKPKAKAKRKKK